MTLVALLACTAPKPADTGPPSAETGPAQDSADPHTAETAESGDSADSRETADTDDTGHVKPDPDWAPGADIPGWEDHDCSETPGGQTAIIHWPDLFLLELAFHEGVAWAGPHAATLQMRDCANFACADRHLDTTDPFVDLRLDGTFGDPAADRGLGSWGPDDTAVRHAAGSGTGIVGDWSDGTTGTFASVSTCLSRVRPDEVTGVLWTEFALPTSFPTSDWYTSVFFAFPFDVVFPDHSGLDSTLPDTGDAPDGFTQAHFLYDLPYDEAWPWDDITDPGIREAVYERYTPYNAR